MKKAKITLVDIAKWIAVATAIVVGAASAIFKN